MRTIEEAINVIGKKMDRGLGSKPVEMELIIKAEKELGVQFPNSYKLFLKEFGVCYIGGQEIYGIVDEDFSTKSIPNVVWYTKQERVDVGLDKALIPICYDGDDFNYCLDTSRIKDGECPVVAVDIAGEECEELYESFTDFLFDECIALTCDE